MSRRHRRTDSLDFDTDPRASRFYERLTQGLEAVPEDGRGRIGEVAASGAPNPHAPAEWPWGFRPANASPMTFTNTSGAPGEASSPGGAPKPSDMGRAEATAARAALWGPPSKPWLEVEVQWDSQTQSPGDRQAPLPPRQPSEKVRVQGTVVGEVKGSIWTSGALPPISVATRARDSLRRHPSPGGDSPTSPGSPRALDSPGRAALVASASEGAVGGPGPHQLPQSQSEGRVGRDTGTYGDRREGAVHALAPTVVHTAMPPRPSLHVGRRQASPDAPGVAGGLPPSPRHIHTHGAKGIFTKASATSDTYMK